jgi:hypothetical protein
MFFVFHHIPAMLPVPTTAVLLYSIIYATGTYHSCSFLQYNINEGCTGYPAGYRIALLEIRPDLADPEIYLSK